MVYTHLFDFEYIFSVILWLVNHYSCMLVLFSLCIFVFVLPIMDQLPPDQQTQICKASSERIRQGLLSAGAEEDVVAGMDRASLKEAAAKQKLQLPSDADRELNMKKLEFEMRKFEREAELELSRMAREEKERERDRRERKRWRKERERKKMEREERERRRERTEREKKNWRRRRGNWSMSSG